MLECKSPGGCMTAGAFLCFRDQQVQHISGLPLQLIIIGMLQSFIIFIIRMQQFFIMSMFMPAIGMILHIMQSAISVHSITHFIGGIGIPIIGSIGMVVFIGICICMAFILVLLPEGLNSWTKLME
nr:hypothetical protein [Pseudomonas sp. PMCC200367]